MKKIIIGDVFSIKTSMGLAYLQYVHNNEKYGALMRVLSRGLDYMPDTCQLCAEKELFCILFPLKSAFNKKIVEKVGNCIIPSHFKLPTHMRSKNIVKGEFVCWHIVEINTLKRDSVQILSEEQLKLSPWGIWNDTLLIESLDEGWSLDNW